MLELASVDGQIAALASPNLATRYLGYTRLVAGGGQSKAALAVVMSKDNNPRLAARAMWVMAVLPEGKSVMTEAMQHAKDLNLRIAAIRAARRIGMDMTEVANRLASDPSIVV